jgi:hypothetical protein
VDREGFWKLISDVNAARTNPLDPSILEESFNTRWPEFEREFKKIKFEGEATAVKTETERLARIEDVLEAILKSNNETAGTLYLLLQAALSQKATNQMSPPGPLGVPPPRLQKIDDLKQLGLLGKLFETEDPKKPK